MSAHVVVVGSLNMDLVVQTPRLPVVGETILGHQFHMMPGGKGANQAVAAARLGAKVSMIGCIGADAYGKALLNNLSNAGVNCAGIRESSTYPTGIAVIVVDELGQNSIVVVPGANMELQAGDLLQAADCIAAADVLLLQLESSLETVIAAAQIARQHNVPVILNPAPAQQLPGKLLSLVDILVPNETEAGLLVDFYVDDIQDALTAGEILSEMIPGTVVLTLGAHGAVWIAGDRIVRIPAFQVQVVDTTAAGDAFVAGLAVALAEGLSMEEALLWGNSAGALTTMTLGAQNSLPSREMVQRFVNSHRGVFAE